MSRVFMVFFLLLAAGMQLGAQSVWTPIPEIGRVYVNTLLEHDGMLFAGTVTTVYRSADDGDRWYPAESFPAATGSPDISDLCTAGSRLFAATTTDGVFVSGDAGKTWTSYGDGLHGLARRVYALVLRGDTLIASTDGAGIYARDIQTNTPWRPYDSGIGWANGGALAVFRDMVCAVVSEFCYTRQAGAPSWNWLPWNPEGFQLTTYALRAHKDRLFAGIHRGMLRWDGTDSLWRPVNLSPAPLLPVTTIASDEEALYATALLSLGSHLVIRSSDAGNSWTILETAQGEVLDLLVSGDRLWSAQSDGLWRRSLDAPLSAEPATAPAGFRLLAPYPQPAGDRAMAEFELGTGGDVTLRLHDALGRIVLTLEESVYHAPGRHMRAIPLHGLPPGTYVLRLSTTDGFVTQMLSHR